MLEHTILAITFTRILLIKSAVALTLIIIIKYIADTSDLEVKIIIIIDNIRLKQQFQIKESQYRQSLPKLATLTAKFFREKKESAVAK